MVWVGSIQYMNSFGENTKLNKVQPQKRIWWFITTIGVLITWSFFGSNPSNCSTHKRWVPTNWSGKKPTVLSKCGLLNLCKKPVATAAVPCSSGWTRQPTGACSFVSHRVLKSHCKVRICAVHRAQKGFWKQCRWTIWDDMVGRVTFAWPCSCLFIGLVTSHEFTFKWQWTCQHA